MLFRSVEPVFEVPAVIHNTYFGLKMPTGGFEGVSEDVTYDEARHFDTEISSEADLEKITTPVVTFDEAATKSKLAQTQEVLDGILDTRLLGLHNFRFALFDIVMSWTGIEQGMYNLSQEPELMHAIARRLVDKYIGMAKEYERLGLISSNNTNALLGNGGYGYCSDLPEPSKSGIGMKLKDIWGAAQDQIFIGVSPAMTEEFAFAYDAEWAQLFERIYYGCCERLDNKAAEIKRTIKNVKKIGRAHV